ncbi:MAG: hypothetical protein HWQ35_12360 [Nostoc sp. NMS1]|uniref:hypothetical protein n=1 Tax=Nostoc sp. NMS1 TaxID=2815388 RepID=UPI0025CBBAF5|nr:hypothetical protein [Nostoc sp. NMS1]MBN3907319.1 hypothetical protein [Nostoc sp. NMS1]
MSQYPIILIPVGIERAKLALPPAPIPPDPPQQPGTKPQKVNNTLIAVETAVAIPTISSLVSCPYCSAKVKTTKFELHKTNKCSKRPLL